MANAQRAKLIDKKSNNKKEWKGKRILQTMFAHPTAEGWTLLYVIVYCVLACMLWCLYVNLIGFTCFFVAFVIHAFFFVPWFNSVFLSYFEEGYLSAFVSSFYFNILNIDNSAFICYWALWRIWMKNIFLIDRR